MNTKNREQNKKIKQHGLEHWQVSSDGPKQKSCIHTDYLIFLNYKFPKT